jgi:MFS family permease
VTFVASALFLTRVRVRSAPPPAEERRTLLAELAEGFHQVRSRSWLWVTVVVFALAVPLANAPLFVLGPTVAESSYDSLALFGIVTTVLGAGAVAGALAGLRWRPRHPMRAALLVLAGWPTLLVVFGAVAPVAIVVVLAFGTGLGFALFDVLWNTAMAERIPAHALSRVSSYDWMGSLVLLPVGFLVAGPLAEASSPETVMILGGVLTAVVLALGLIPRQTRMLERIEHAGSEP